ncbi:RNA polymerase sigma factor [Tunicatimonas pelagia]|uniref:RNA polymerase sigma factor n=1 Tax=Tunicatimonas pelagia TaxID=931531 RepID=UPI0026666018|nr:sigma-70 family RNA polymerase sigma factor [Tunicatimonas pelagia]WKN44885.1 sigma-70 family RNA polymerase sigma factor [Tunicatimonas pelagia]
MGVTLPDETSVWKQFKQGDSGAYEAIYQCYYDQLYNYGRKFTADCCLVEDCIQQLFVNLWKNKNRLTTPPSVKNYLYKSFRTTLFKQLRQTNRSVHNQYEALPFTVSLSAETQRIQSEQQAELHAWLQKAIKDLSAHQREAIFLKFYDQLSYQEISEVMQIEMRSAYDLVHKGLARLRKRHTLEPLPLISWMLLLIAVLSV